MTNSLKLKLTNVFLVLLIIILITMSCVSVYKIFHSIINDQMINKIEQYKKIGETLAKENIMLQNEVNSLFSPYNLKTEIEKQQIRFPDIVFNQARLETGNFTSNVMYKYHNLFGFTRQKLIKFDTWIDCVIFYKKWQDKYFTQTTKEEYYQFLKNYPFSSNPSYIDTLKLMQNDARYKDFYVR